jgi:hypothetical protein
MSSRRLIETTLLGLVGVLLAVATVNDVVRQTRTNQRLSVDLHAWRGYTGRNYRNLTVEQDVKHPGSTREVVCGNTSPGAPKERQQLCLVMTGPVVHGRRAVDGGYYLPPLLPADTRSARYACFGAAKSEELCPPASTATSPGTG